MVVPQHLGYMLASRNDVGSAILHKLGNESVLHFEEHLWAAGYESIRMAPEPGVLTASWLTRFHLLIREPLRARRPHNGVRFAARALPDGCSARLRGRPLAPPVDGEGRVAGPHGCR